VALWRFLCGGVKRHHLCAHYTLWHSLYPRVFLGQFEILFFINNFVSFHRIGIILISVRSQHQVVLSTKEVEFFPTYCDCTKCKKHKKTRILVRNCLSPSLEVTLQGYSSANEDMLGSTRIFCFCQNVVLNVTILKKFL
jgi:hypothetical protein